MPGPKPGVIPNMGDVSAATRVLLAQVSGGTRTRRAPTRRKKKTTANRRKRRVTGKRRPARTTRRAKKGGRLKKGSPEAKRRMAQLRKMRRR